MEIISPCNGSNPHFVSSVFSSTVSTVSFWWLPKFSGLLEKSYKRDAQLVAHAARIRRVLERAASAGRLARLLRIFAQRQVYADNIVTSLNKARSRYRGVDSPTHRR